jgi:hypothetical protein
MTTTTHAERALHPLPPLSEPTPAPAPISEAAARILGALGVVGIAIIHILDAPGTFGETRWIFWAYIALIVAAVPVACLLLQWASPRAWLLAAGLAAGPFIAYLLSRTVGLPGDSGDVGNWLDSLGMTSLFVEGSLIVLAISRVRDGRREGSRAH